MKIQYHLIPAGPLRELALAYTIGNSKHSEDDWKTRYTTKIVYSKLMRHLEEWRAGEDRAEDGQHHLAAVAFHAFTLLWYTVNRPEADDIPDRSKNAQPIP